MNSAKGFTLIEMLVSMTLLTMLLLLTTSAYSLFNERWDGKLGNYNKSLYATKNLLIIHEILSSVISYVVVDDEDNPAYYFDGNLNGFVAVSNTSMSMPGSASIIRLQVNQNADFTFNISYQEAVMNSFLLLKHDQKVTFDEPIYLFENLKQAKVEYYGWPTRRDKFFDASLNSKTRKPKGWFNEYNSIALGVHPEQIKITLGDSGDAQHVIHLKLNDAMISSFNNYYPEEA